ncbi:MAG: oligosaccharide flippase family protein [Steroidobacteraceae bacterium]
MRGELTSKALRGGALSVSTKVANLVVGMGSLAILARLFTPAEYGQFGILMLITTICAALPTAIGQALIHEGSPDSKTTASFTWIFLAVLMMTVCLLFAARPALVTFFTKSLSPAEYNWLFLVAPLACICAYLDGRLSHAHRFEALAAGDMALQILGSVLCTIGLSFFFNGVAALIGGTLCGYVIKLCIQTWALGISRNVPRPASFAPRLKSVAHFAAIHIANYFGLYGDNLAVAKLLGSAELGIYGRAYNLMSKPVMTLSGFITSVYFPLMVVAREDKQAFRSGYLKAMAFAAMVGLPLGVYLALASREIIAILMGETWLAAAVPFGILAAASYFRLAYRITETVNLARNSLFNSVARQSLYGVMIVGGSVFGSRWGVTGVALAVAGALAIFFCVSLVKANRTADCSIAACLKISVPAALGTVVATLIMLVTWRTLGSDTTLMRLCESLSFWIVYGMYWVGACRLWPRDVTVGLLQSVMDRSRRMLAPQS